MESVSNCEYARKRHRELLLVRHAWSGLLLILGVAVVGFLVAAILLFMRESWLPVALTAVGTIVTGTGTGFVVRMRDKAVDEEESAYRDVVTACDQQTGDLQRQEFAPALLTTARQKRASAELQSKLELQRDIDLLASDEPISSERTASHEQTDIATDEAASPLRRDIGASAADDDGDTSPGDVGGRR